MSGKFTLVIQLALGVVFVRSAAGKLKSPAAFVRGVADYQILPKKLIRPLGFLIIGIEVWLAISHLTGWSLAIALPVGLCTLFGFAVAVAVNLLRGRTVPCLCFGSQKQEMISRRTLARLVLVLLGEVILTSKHGIFSSNWIVFPHQIANLSNFGLSVFWTAYVLLAGMWTLSSGDLLDMFRFWKQRRQRQRAIESLKGV